MPSQPLVGVEFVEWMDSGHWFVSIYNDDGEEEEAHLVIYPAEEMNSACPRGCSQHGECILGKCQCHPGYGGDDCSQGGCSFYPYTETLGIEFMLLRSLGHIFYG